MSFRKAFVGHGEGFWHSAVVERNVVRNKTTKRAQP
jgi:hypothetical protein